MVQMRDDETDSGNSVLDCRLRIAKRATEILNGHLPYRETIDLLSPERVLQVVAAFEKATQELSQ